jgi:tRNA-dihydrouridine synthase A
MSRIEKMDKREEMDSNNQKFTPPKISIAPMIDRTDKHFRYFCRLITQESLLYTEMITTHAILHGDRKKLLDFNPIEKPLALQIAGCDPAEIYEAVKIAEDWDYDEINLNVGCPSDRVSGNEMGAVLMAYPNRVYEMVEAIKKSTSKPVTVKNRIGIDGTHVLPPSFSRTLLDQYEDLKNFIEIVSKDTVDRFIIHARIAILRGLSPKENREIPPLRYEDVYRLKEEYPDLPIVINGGIQTRKDIETHLKHVDGVMIGRAAYDNPVFLATFDSYCSNKSSSGLTRKEILKGFMPYIEEEEKKGTPTHLILRHLSGLFHEKKGSRAWKQMISPPFENQPQGIYILKKALENLPQEILNEPL